ncbi:MAG: hypothetical protein NTX59_11990 [Elusimicrobia bacterium]|nr:hypothetical protein [Elusimicrobiota bacterium]
MSKLSDKTAFLALAASFAFSFQSFSFAGDEASREIKNDAAREISFDRNVKEPSFEYKPVSLPGGGIAHVYIVTLTDYSLSSAQSLVKKLVEDSKNRNLVKGGDNIKFLVTGHGWRAVAEDHLQYAAFLSKASASDIGIILNFPEFRSNTQSFIWHSCNVSAARKTAALVAAINTTPGAVTWLMYGESAMAEIIVRMYDEADSGIKNLLAVKSNAVVDSYPFSAWPFVPRKVNENWLKQLGGSLYVNHTIFGHWSNKLRGGPQVVNICIAPRGQAVGHGQYENLPESIELERMEVSGASLESLTAYVKGAGPCEDARDEANKAAQPALGIERVEEMTRDVQW